VHQSAAEVTTRKDSAKKPVLNEVEGCLSVGANQLLPRAESAIGHKLTLDGLLQATLSSQ